MLDVLLPGLDGFEVCRQLRDRGRFTPVLFLTALDEPDDRIKGFVTGGDDYLTKPFSVDELVLRAAAILRRTGHAAPSDLMVVGDLTLDPAGHEVRRGGTLIELSPTEFRLLHYLMTNAGTVRVQVPDPGERLGLRLSRAARTWSSCTSATCAARSTTTRPH